MKGYELFGVVVRTLGLLSIVQGITALPSIPQDAWLFGGTMTLHFVAGAILFFGADVFVRNAYHRVTVDEPAPISR
jgi:hypothetical protein